jgi:putative addiction module component (TIGR02574 family)
MTDLRQQIGSLAPDEKAELIDEFWESLGADARPLTETQREELDHRLDPYERSPSDVIPWERVRADLFTKR